MRFHVVTFVHLTILVAALGIGARASTITTRPGEKSKADATVVEPSNRIEEHEALVAAAKAALARGEVQLAYRYMSRVNAMPEATFVDGMNRMRIAIRRRNTVDAVVVDCLTAVVARWPEQVSEIDEDLIIRVFRDSKNNKNFAALPLLQALYDAHWKFKSDLEPSWAWQELAALLLQKGKLAAAIDVSMHVTDPYDLIAMRADRRFDAVVAANRAHFDLAAAAEQQFESIERALTNSPRSLEFKLLEMSALQHRQHYGAMLAAAEAVESEVQSTNFPERLFGDYEKEYAWVLDRRAYALVQEGRSDDAIGQLSKASLRMEGGGGNISQVINLAYLYCALGRPQDALRTLDSMTGKPSAYGNTQVEMVRVCAAKQLGDEKTMTRSLEVLKMNREDAPYAYLQALLVASETNQAAKFLVARLLATRTRLEVLECVQDYERISQPPSHLEVENQWHALIGRADVQAAISKVGRIESYRLEPPEILQ